MHIQQELSSQFSLVLFSVRDTVDLQSIYTDMTMSDTASPH